MSTAVDLQPLETRLRAVEVQLAALLAVVQRSESTLSTLTRHQVSLLERHDHALFGNGREGLTQRLSRLESHHRRLTANAAAVWAAVLAFAVKLLSDLYKGMP